MKDRILLFLKEKSLSATRFADEIGVQRSSISHILSGRNKPSLDFIEKVLSTYKDISAEWFLRGKGEMYGNISKNATISANTSASLFANVNSNEIKPNQDADNQSNKQMFTSVNNDNDDNLIEKIVVFYKNKTFEVYHNSV